MIINGTPRVLGSYTAPAVKSPARDQKTGSKDNVLAISDHAKDYQKVRAEISQTPDVRQERIDELKSKYESGSYFVDSTEIAGKILDA